MKLRDWTVANDHVIHQNMLQIYKLIGIVLAFKELKKKKKTYIKFG
jgi:hypothetical protein